MPLGLRLPSRRQGLSQYGPNKLSNLYAWYRSDRGITLNGSTVAAWADQGANGFHAIQASAINQPNYNVSNVTMNSRPTINGDASNDSLVAGTNTNWGCLHKGTGVTVALYFDTGSSALNRVLLSTMSVSLAVNGIWIGYSGASKQAQCYLANGGGVNYTIGGALSPVMPTGAVSLLFRYSESNSPKATWKINNGAPSSIIMTGVAPSALDNSNGALTLLNQPGGGNSSDVAVAEYIIWDRYLTDTEASTLYTTYSKPRYNLP